MDRLQREWTPHEEIYFLAQAFDNACKADWPEEDRRRRKAAIAAACADCCARLAVAASCSDRPGWERATARWSALASELAHAS